MPKIDPVTGCQVMTEGEFWQSEANAEGRDAGELRSEFYDDMERDRKETEDRYREPAEALRTLVAAVERQNEAGECQLPAPIHVLEVLEVNLGENFRETKLRLRARATRADGVEDFIEFESWHSSGSREEPPEGEENVTWENLDDEGKPIIWAHLYTIRHPSQVVTSETTLRRNKVEWLHTVIRRGGARARIREERLEYDQNKKEDVYRVLAKYLIDLSPGNHLFNGVI